MMKAMCKQHDSLFDLGKSKSEGFVTRARCAQHAHFVGASLAAWRALKMPLDPFAN